MPRMEIDKRRRYYLSMRMCNDLQLRELLQGLEKLLLSRTRSFRNSNLRQVYEPRTVSLIDWLVPALLL